MVNLGNKHCVYHILYIISVNCGSIYNHLSYFSKYYCMILVCPVQYCGDIYVYFINSHSLLKVKRPSHILCSNLQWRKMLSTRLFV